MTKKSINSVEEETMKRVAKTLSTINEFLNKWDEASAPDDLIPQIVKIRKFRDALSSWKEQALKTKGKEPDETMMRRLQEFVLICQTYS